LTFEYVDADDAARSAHAGIRRGVPGDATAVVCNVPPVERVDDRHALPVGGGALARDAERSAGLHTT